MTPVGVPTVAPKSPAVEWVFRRKGLGKAGEAAAVSDCQCPHSSLESEFHTCRTIREK